MRFGRAMGIAALLGVSAIGCGRQAVEPGQRGLRYDPHGGGVKPEVMQPGSYSLGWCFMRDCGYIETYDITYQTRKEALFTPSAEGLAMDVRVSVMYRPVVSELFQLHTEVGRDYYEAVLGPHFRSAARSVLARHSYTNLVGQLGKIEEEIVTEVKRRVQGKHVEISGITLENVKYASPEIAAAVEKRLIGLQEAQRQKAAIEAHAARERTKLELEAAQAKLKAETEATHAKLQAELATDKSKREAELEVERAKNQRIVVQEQLAVAKLEAQQKVIRAKAAAEERKLLADAKAAENRADAAAHTPLTVQAAGYEALGKLGGSGTTLLLGDWSRAPQFLWPRGMGGFPMMTPAPGAAVRPSGYRGPDKEPTIKPLKLPLGPGRLQVTPIGADARVPDL